jgi:hypothetical protein
MKKSGTLVHPEMEEFMHICAISPDGSKDVCEHIQTMEGNDLKEKDKVKMKKRKKDKELDRDLKDSFPASDPLTHY